jgi:hypothetical protein
MLIIMNGISIGQTNLIPSDKQIKIGKTFQNDQKNYTFKGSSSKTGKSYYKYNRPSSSLVYGHSVDYVILIVKNGLIVGFSYFLIPKSTDNGVPNSMLNKFKSDSGFALGKVGNEVYGAQIENIKVTFQRVNKSVLGGDRIIIKVDEI